MGKLIDPQRWRRGLGDKELSAIDTLEQWIAVQGYDLKHVEWFDDGRSGGLVARVVRLPRPGDQVILKFLTSADRAVRLQQAYDELHPFCVAHMAKLTPVVNLLNGHRFVFMEIAKGNLTLYRKLAEFYERGDFPTRCGTIVRSVISDWNPRPQPLDRQTGIVISDIVGDRAEAVLEWDPVKPAADGQDPRSLLTGPESQVMIENLLTGKAHGDLSARNVLLDKRRPESAESFQLIDYDHFAGDAPLAYDPMHLLVALALDEFETVQRYPQMHIDVILDPDFPGDAAPISHFHATSRAIHDAVRESFSHSGYGGDHEPQCWLALAGAGLVHLGRELRVADQQQAKQWCYDLATAAAAKFGGAYNTSDGPDPPPEMLGREDQYRTLHRHLVDRPRGIVIVQGMAGMGKTNLLNVTLQSIGKTSPLVRPARIGRHLATPERPLDLRTLIDLISGGSGPETLPGGLSSLVRLEAVLKEMGRTPVVVAVDSAESLLGEENHTIIDPDLDDAFEMLSDEPEHRVAVVLATQRAPHSLSGLHWPLDKPPVFVREVDCRRFLQYLSDRVPAVADLPKEQQNLLWRRLSGNPRHAELVHALTRVPGGPSLPALVEGLPRRRVEVTKHLIRLLVERLPERERAVVDRLAVLSTPVYPEVVVGALAGAWPADQVEAALSTLSEWQVCRKDDHEYFLPIAEALIVLHHIAPRERSAMLSEAAEALHEHQNPDPQTRADLRLWFAEIKALIRAGEHAVAFDVIDELDLLLIEWNCQHLLLEDREEIRKHLVEHDQRLSNENALAGIYLNRGDLEKADQAYGRALVLARKASRRSDRVALHNNLGLVRLAEHDIDRALTEFTFALGDAESDDDVNGQVGALEGLAECHRHSSEHEQAIAIAAEAVRRGGPEHPRRRDLALRLSRWNAELADFGRAWEWLAIAERTGSGPGDVAGTAFCRAGRADLRLAKHLSNRQEEQAAVAAVEDANTALDLALRLGNPRTLQSARITLCVAHLLRREYDEAALQARRAAHYRRPPPPLVLLALRALVARLTDHDESENDFDRLYVVTKARAKRNPRDLSAWDYKGFAECGRFLEGHARIRTAVASLSKGRRTGPDGNALKRPKAPGLDARFRYMLELLDSTSNERSLQPAIDVLDER
jgi:tetratricopeptide (TPR) repeat protein